MSNERLEHAEIEELLGAYALDAVEVDERSLIEAHLVTCLRCRQEVAEHRETAALLAQVGAPAPDGLWERLAASLEEEAPDFQLPQPASPSASPVISLDHMHNRRNFRIARSMSAVAAALVFVLLGLQVVNQNRKIDNLASQLEEGDLHRAATQVLEDPQAQRVVLRGTDGSMVATVALAPDGAGYLVRHDLAPLPEHRTYQLWALAGEQRVSLGILGRNPAVTAFRVPDDIDGLAFTDEADPGATQSTNQPVAVGFLKQT